MECISVFGMLKIGIGPSSSHTLGPWRAAERWITELKTAEIFDKVQYIKVDLYGSLSLTGKGHATDLAIMLGLSGANPELIPIEDLKTTIDAIKTNNSIFFNNEKNIEFKPESDIIFNKKFLPFHANGLVFSATINGKNQKSTFYSIGGGFVVKEERKNSKRNKEIFKTFPYPIKLGTELLVYCKNINITLIPPLPFTRPTKTCKDKTYRDNHKNICKKDKETGKWESATETALRLAQEFIDAQKNNIVKCWVKSEGRLMDFQKNKKPNPCKQTANG